MTYQEFVEQRIEIGPDDEREPFCPFRTPNCMGYCDVAYSEYCYSCEESLGEYVTRYCNGGDRLCGRIMDRFESGHDREYYAELTKEFLEEIGVTYNETLS